MSTSSNRRAPARAAGNTEALRVSLYLRVSTDRQAKEGDSLEEQEAELRKYCEFRKFRIHKIHIERGKSGGNTNRPEYQRLLADVKAKKIDAVVVKKIDRLSRSLLDFEAFMKLLAENGLEFISIKENFDTTLAMGKAMLRVALVFAQLEREQNSERVSDVMRHRASQGLFNGGPPPYGYTLTNKELIPYPKEKKIVELIFKTFLDTKSTTEVARSLNQEGLRNRQGKLWDRRRIQLTLQNPLYIGKIFWEDRYYPGIQAPLISEKQFEAAQTLFKGGYRIGPESRTKALLQKLLICGHCQSPMTPTHSLNKYKVKYYYYRCVSTKNAKKKKSTCPVKYIAFQEADDLVVDQLLALAEDRHFHPIENRLLKHNAVIDEALHSLSEDSHRLKASLDTITTRKDKYLDSLLSSQLTKVERQTINQRLSDMALEEKHIHSQLLKLDLDTAEKADEKISITELKTQLITFKANLEDFSRDQLRHFLRSHLDHIGLTTDTLSLRFKSLPWPIDHPRNHPKGRTAT